MNFESICKFTLREQFMSLLAVDLIMSYRSKESPTFLGSKKVYICQKKIKVKIPICLNLEFARTC
jgi:hypothetical protein